MPLETWELPEISALDLAWLAGLLEGEGCFGEVNYPQWKRTKAPGKQIKRLPCIQINMTCPDVIERAARLIGGGQRAPHRRSPRGIGRKVQYTWRVNGRRAAHLMQLLLPHMGKRRSNRISAILERYDIAGVYSPTAGSGG